VARGHRGGPGLSAGTTRLPWPPVCWGMSVHCALYYPCFWDAASCGNAAPLSLSLSHTQTMCTTHVWYHGRSTTVSCSDTTLLPSCLHSGPERAHRNQHLNAVSSSSLTRAHSPSQDEEGGGDGSEDGVLLLKPHASYVSGLQWLSDGSSATLYTCAYDGVVRRLDTAAASFVEVRARSTVSAG
jgi:hypothetical protein